MPCFCLPDWPLLKKIKTIEFFYVFMPVLFLVIATFGTVSQFIRIATDYKEIFSPYMLIAGDIKQNLEQRPISDLQVVNSSEWYCPTGYNPLVISSWPGNKVGCYNMNDGTLSTKGCSSHTNGQNITGWKDIFPNQNMILGLWGTYRFCAAYDHYEPIDSETGQCPAGYKPCSKGQLCALEGHNCPVTSVSLNWKNNGWNLSMALSLTIARDPEENPLIDIHTSVNGLPCLNPSRLPVLKGAPTYPLEENTPEGCDEFGINQASIQGIDQESLLQFYNENKLGTMIESLPNYSDYLSKSTAVLFSKSQVELNTTPTCQQDMDAVLGTIIANLREFSFSSGIMTTLIAYDIIVIIFGLVMFFYLYVDKENEEREKYFREQKCLFHSFHFIPYILCVFFIAQYSEMPANGGEMANNVLTATGIINNNQCFSQEQYSSIFLQLVDEINSTTAYYFRATKVMGIISYAFVVLMLTVRGLRGYFIQEVEEFENTYLENKFAEANRNQPETEMTSSEMPSNQQVEPSGEYEDVYNDLYPSYPY